MNKLGNTHSSLLNNLVEASKKPSAKPEPSPFSAQIAEMLKKPKQRSLRDIFAQQLGDSTDPNMDMDADLGMGDSGEFGEVGEELPPVGDEMSEVGGDLSSQLRTKLDALEQAVSDIRQVLDQNSPEGDMVDDIPPIDDAMGDELGDDPMLDTGGEDLDAGSDMPAPMPMPQDDDEENRNMFADPGGNSALRRSTQSNPRNLPCPNCGTPNSLTPADARHGYQCDNCANAAEGVGGYGS